MRKISKDIQNIINKCNKAKIGDKVKVLDKVLEVKKYSESSTSCMVNCFFGNKKDLCPFIDCTGVFFS